MLAVKNVTVWSYEMTCGHCSNIWLYEILFIMSPINVTMYKTSIQDFIWRKNYLMQH